MGLCPKPRSLSNKGEWLQGKRPFPGARIPFWEPIAPSGLLGLLSSIALSIPAVCPARTTRSEAGRKIAWDEIYSTFAQINCFHFCSACNMKFSFKRPDSQGDRFVRLWTLVITGYFKFLETLVIDAACFHTGGYVSSKDVAMSLAYFLPPTSILSGSSICFSLAAGSSFERVRPELTSFSNTK